MNNREMELLMLSYKKSRDEKQFGSNIIIDWPAEEYNNNSDRVDAQMRDLNALNALQARNFITVVERGSYLEFIKYRITPFGEDYIDALKAQSQNIIPSINIGSVNGPGIAGGQSHASISLGSDLDRIYDIIQTLSGNDRIEGERLLKEVKELKKETDSNKRQQGMSKIFSNFSDFLAKHSPLVAAIVTLLAK